MHNDNETSLIYMDLPYIPRVQFAYVPRGNSFSAGGVNENDDDNTSHSQVRQSDKLSLQMEFAFPIHGNTNKIVM